MTTPACHNFAGMAANRFLLGLLEATVNPGFVLVMSMWYTSAEQPLRLGAYYCTNGIATMFGGLIGYAVGHIKTGLPRWMYVFLIFGSASTVMGIAILLFLPDLPTTAKFLTERQRGIAVDRVSGNRQGVKNKHFKTYQAWQTLYDPKTWILFVMATGAQIPNSALTTVSSCVMVYLLSCLQTTVQLHDHQVLRCGHARDAIPSNSRRCCAIRLAACRKLHLYPLAEYSMSYYDCCEHHMHHRRKSISRATQQQQMGSARCVVDVLLPRSWI